MTDTSREALIKDLRWLAHHRGYTFASQVADMLEADAQQAKREPLSDAAIEDIWTIAREANDFPEVFARAIEAAHGIGAKP